MIRKNITFLAYHIDTKHGKVDDDFFFVLHVEGKINKWETISFTYNMDIYNARFMAYTKKISYGFR